jgi:hypothetical protein
VQTGHVIADFSYQHPEAFHKWKNDSNSIICLSVPSEEKLLKLYEKYRIRGPATAFYEPDVSEWTSVCLFGTPEIRKELSHLPLSLKNNN